MDTVIRVQILDEDICVSYGSNTLERYDIKYSPYSYG